MQQDVIKAMQPFVIMAKPVGSLCNLACGYCYYSKTEHFYEDHHPQRMSDETLETFVRAFIQASPGPVVQFIWHGGEPTLAGIDFYRRAAELQKRFLPEGWTCWNNLQTNGVLLDDEWCAFLADEHFDVGLSIDGTQSVHDAFRKDPRGNGSYEQAKDAVRRLQAYGIQPDLLCTVTSQTAMESVTVYRSLRDLGTGWLQFIPIVNRTPDGAVAPESVSAEAYGDFLCAVFDEWLHHDLGRVDVQLFAETSLVWSGGSANICTLSPTCGRALIVEYDGSVYSCDHFVTPEHRIGSILTSGLGELADSDVQRRFGQNKRALLPGQCKNCQWLPVCSGGCPKDRFLLSQDGEPGLNYLCKGFRRFFSHAEKPLLRAMQLSRQGGTPETIMAEFNAEWRTKWKGIGRNDPCPCGSGKKAKNCCWDRRPQTD